jgi:AraC-like DNA-binding protein
VVGAIIAALRESAPSVGSTARALGISGRTLQRQLERRGVSHRQLLETARWRLATVLLARPGSTVKFVAIALGYANARAFAYAFRRWTGRAPRAVIGRSGAANPDNEGDEAGQQGSQPIAGDAPISARYRSLVRGLSPSSELNRARMPAMLPAFE